MDKKERLLREAKRNCAPSYSATRRKLTNGAGTCGSCRTGRAEANAIATDSSRVFSMKSEAEARKYMVCEGVESGRGKKRIR